MGAQEMVHPFQNPRLVSRHNVTFKNKCLLPFTFTSKKVAPAFSHLTSQSETVFKVEVTVLTSVSSVLKTSPPYRTTEVGVCWGRDDVSFSPVANGKLTMLQKTISHPIDSAQWVTQIKKTWKSERGWETAFLCISIKWPFISRTFIVVALARHASPIPTNWMRHCSQQETQRELRVKHSHIKIHYMHGRKCQRNEDSVCCIPDIRAIHRTQKGLGGNGLWELLWKYNNESL